MKDGEWKFFLEQPWEFLNIFILPKLSFRLKWNFSCWICWGNWQNFSLKLFDKFSKRNSCLSSNKCTENMNIGTIIKFSGDKLFYSITIYFIVYWVQCFANICISTKMEEFSDHSLHWQYRILRWKLFCKWKFKFLWWKLWILWAFNSKLWIFEEFRV